MFDDRAFVEAIASNPGDGVLRLVYADWLEEHGEFMRAEFLRLEAALATLPTRDDPPLAWGTELPPVEDRYPPLLWQLSEKARDIDLDWLATVSVMGVEIRRILTVLPSKLSAAPTPSASSLSRRKALASVRDMYIRRLGATAVESFLVPLDYRLFLALLPGRITWPEKARVWCFDQLHDSERMAEATIEFCDMNVESSRRSAADYAQSGLWLFVGYRDKHDFHLCCQWGHPMFGLVVDEHDSHPWMHAPHHPPPWYVMHRSFVDLLRWSVSQLEPEGKE